MKLISLTVALGLIVGAVTVEALSEPTGEDCGTIHRDYPTAKSGVYSIKVSGGTRKVYCDMDTACGGWTVFQRRKDGSENFTRPWPDYANGFGYLRTEFWMGNEFLADLTSARPYRLRIDLEDWAGVRTYAEYSSFKVAGAADKYRMAFLSGSYFGNAGDGMTYHNNMTFTTIDQDNDQREFNCAETFRGGWWYYRCHQSNLNGEYNSTVTGKGINWKARYEYSYKIVEMKIRGAEW